MSSRIYYLTNSRQLLAKILIKNASLTRMLSTTNWKYFDMARSVDVARRPLRVAIEGNIGAGKSTFVEFFKQLDYVETYGEPIESWRNVNGNNLLELMYSNIHEWLKVFQNYVQLTRLKIQTSQPKSQNTTVQMFERSLQNNRFCFVELAYKGGYLTAPDYAVLDEWYKWIESNIDIKLDLIVYLRSKPELVYERIKARGRPEESGMSLDYLQLLHESHEDWLMGDQNSIPVVVLDADKPVSAMIEDYKMVEEKIVERNTTKAKRKISFN